MFTYFAVALNSLSQHDRIGAPPVFCFPLAVFVGSNEYIAYTLHISSLCVGLKYFRLLFFHREKRAEIKSYPTRII